MPLKSLNVQTLKDFDYDLPEELIAQAPAGERDSSRLLTLHKLVPAGSKQGESGLAAAGIMPIEHGSFRDIPYYLKKGDLLVFNDTKVIPARLAGRKPTGGRVELLLVKKVSSFSGCEVWESMVKPGKGIKKGVEIFFGEVGEGLKAVALAPVEDKAEGGLWKFALFSGGGDDVKVEITRLGKIPLPPYIRREPEVFDSERYQTIYARNEGAVAAPTAGLHFTEAVFKEITNKGVVVSYLTLHTGPATFLPIRAVDISKHTVPPEYYSIPLQTASAVEAAKKEGRRVVAVGSTVVRALEAAFANGFGKAKFEGETSLVVYPGFKFKIVDAMVTNFHLPRSSLLLLVAAFAGKDNLLNAYREAVKERYRFFSYGDCMFII